MSFIFSPNIIQIQEYINDNKYTLLISYLKKCQLESLTDSPIISKLIDRLNSQSNYLIMIYFLDFLVEYPIQVFQNETNDAIAILLKHSNGIENPLYNVLSRYINKKRVLDPDIISQALSVFFNQQPKGTEDKYNLYFNLTIEYIHYNTDLPHSFWEKVIRLFQSNNQLEYSKILLQLYPLKYSLSESYWKKQIDMNQDLIDLFNVFNAKFSHRQLNEHIDSYQKIFNYFIRINGIKYRDIDDQTAMMIFNTVIDNNIQIDEESLLIFISNYTKANISSQSCIKNVLIKAKTNMTSKIASHVISILYEGKEYESMISIIRSIQKREIIAEFDLLNINKEVAKMLESNTKDA